MLPIDLVYRFGQKIKISSILYCPGLNSNKIIIIKRYFKFFNWETIALNSIIFNGKNSFIVIKFTFNTFIRNFIFCLGFCI